MEQNTAEWDFVVISRLTGNGKGKRYAIKQIEAYAVNEGGDWLVITIVVKYF